MVRHYEQMGHLPVAECSESGYRLYGEREISVLRFIRQSRRLGFSVAQIAELTGLWSDSQRTSREVKAVAQRHAIFGLKLLVTPGWVLCTCGPCSVADVALQT
jgi:MerR family copper efflux transcriptional regulator